MLTINFKQIYETNERVDKEWVLIIYDISANHYVGMPVYSKEKEGCIYCNSINKYVDINKIADYNRSKMNRCIYVHGKPLKLTKKDFNLILQEGKNSLLEFLNKNIKSDIEGISYIKWCRDKYIINKKDVEEDKLIQNAGGHIHNSSCKKLTCTMYITGKPGNYWISHSDYMEWRYLVCHQNCGRAASEHSAHYGNPGAGECPCTAQYTIPAGSHTYWSCGY